ncbi:MAG: hypothetical protein ACRDFS_09615 [Chloroflexota bacterium]
MMAKKLPRAFSVQLRRNRDAAISDHLSKLREAISKAAVARPHEERDPMDILFPADENPADLSAGQAALHLVVEAFRTRNHGKIKAVDPLAHRALQYLNGYRVWPIDPAAVVSWFPRVYEALRVIDQTIPRILESALRPDPCQRSRARDP